MIVRDERTITSSFVDPACHLQALFVGRSRDGQMVVHPLVLMSDTKHGAVVGSCTVPVHLLVWLR
jgi:hypothetical protein